MAKRWTRQPFQFVCLTDRPHLITDAIRTIQVARIPHCWAFWTKVRLFDPRLGFTGRMLAMDLDSLIVGPLDDFADFPGPLVLATDALVEVPDEVAPLEGARDRHGRALVQKFQGSIMVWDAGAVDDLFLEWAPVVARRLSTDQDWVGEQYPFAARVPLAWTPRISQIREGPIPPEARLIFCKKPKNHEAAEIFPWVADVWGAA
jgi:hypothetical protein